jgi:hypothetical protein
MAQQLPFDKVSRGGFFQPKEPEPQAPALTCAKCGAKLDGAFRAEPDGLCYWCKRLGKRKEDEKPNQ